jgi:predicted DsbA family dithiol-disulfide isomerase
MKKRLLFPLLFLLCCISVFAQPKLAITSYCDVRLESCKVQDQALALLEEKYSYDITVDYLYYFDIEDPQSSLAQIAVECANKQGLKQEYKTELQNNIDVLTMPALKQYAEYINADTNNFTFCFDTQMSAWDVLAEVEEAENDGVTTAPTVRFNQDIYEGSQTFTSLNSMINEYLQGSSAEPSTVEEIVTEQPKETEENEEVPVEETQEQEVQEEKEEESTEELQQIEEPLFYRAIKQIRVWMLGLFQ